MFLKGNIYKIVTLTILMFLSLTNNSLSKEVKIKISKNKVNGIYRIYDNFDKSITYYYAICGDNSHKYRIAVKSLKYQAIYQKGSSEPKIIEIKHNIRYWSPVNKDFTFYGVKNELSNSIRVHEIELPSILIYYLRVRKDTISMAEFIMNNDDYETSLFGYKEFEEFNIREEKTNKVIEICKSR